MKEIFENYDVFYTMLLSVTMMSNAQTDEVDVDGRKIIDFIGKAYKLSDTFIEKCKYVILDKLTPVALTSEPHAIYRARKAGDSFSEDEVLYDIKGDVLNTVQNIGSDNRAINRSWFDYSHYKTYEPHIRFSKINATGATGDKLATRQIGILKALGIGCDANLEEAADRFFQCAVWADVPSMYLLAHCYSLMGNAEKSKIFYELAEISTKYLFTGCTVLPESVKATNSEEACTYYVYISSIYQDIILAFNRLNINFSFVEALTSDGQDYFSRMNLINDFQSGAWKEITNSSQKPSKKFGFN